MRHDVDLPQAMIDAQKRGELVLFAGAGVSIDAPSNYPNFLDLATEDRVKNRLSDPGSRQNHLDQAIVRLFGSTSAIQVVTTGRVTPTRRRSILTSTSSTL